MDFIDWLLVKDIQRPKIVKAGSNCASGRTSETKRNTFQPSIRLDEEQSAVSGEQLLDGLGTLQPAEEVADWVHENMRAKNTLTVRDADCVEARFRDRLAMFDLASDSDRNPSGASVLHGPALGATPEAGTAESSAVCSAHPI
jgi:hypothetical protein